jgi:archaellum component FlaC
MANIKEIKESASVRLDRLDARADAFQAALGAGESQIQERIAHRKQKIRRALDKLSSDIDQQNGLPPERKQAARSLVDNLNEQIDLSCAAAQETLAYGRRQIQESAQKLEAELDNCLATIKGPGVELSKASLGAYARALDGLDAELEAAEARLSSIKDKVIAAFDQRRQAVEEEIDAFRRQFREKKAQAGEGFASLEEELHEKFEQTVKTFKNLFS